MLWLPDHQSGFLLSSVDGTSNSNDLFNQLSGFLLVNLSILLRVCFISQSPSWMQTVAQTQFKFRERGKVASWNAYDLQFFV